MDRRVKYLTEDDRVEARRKSWRDANHRRSEEIARYSKDYRQRRRTGDPLLCWRNAWRDIGAAIKRLAKSLAVVFRPISERRRREMTRAFRLQVAFELAQLHIQHRPYMRRVRHQRKAEKRWSRDPDKVRLHLRVARFRQRCLENYGLNTSRGLTAHIRMLLKKQGNACAYCRTKFRGLKFEIDHIIPRAKGGSNRFENFQLLCSNCNNAKSDKMPHVFAREVGLLL